MSNSICISKSHLTIAIIVGVVVLVVVVFSSVSTSKTSLFSRAQGTVTYPLSIPQCYSDSLYLKGEDKKYLGKCGSTESTIKSETDHSTFCETTTGKGKKKKDLFPAMVDTATCMCVTETECPGKNPYTSSQSISPTLVPTSPSVPEKVLSPILSIKPSQTVVTQAIDITYITEESLNNAIDIIKKYFYQKLDKLSLEISENNTSYTVVDKKTLLTNNIYHFVYRYIPSGVWEVYYRCDKKDEMQPLKLNIISRDSKSYTLGGVHFECIWSEPGTHEITTDFNISALEISIQKKLIKQVNVGIGYR